MNFKDLFFPIAFAFLTTWAIHHFFLGSPSVVSDSTLVRSGQSFNVAPTKGEIESKPLNLEVDFIDTISTATPVITHMQTDHEQLLFSTEGASLENLTFKRTIDGKFIAITTIHRPNSTEREQRAFLVGFNQLTPYEYEFVDEKKEADLVAITYKATTEQAIVTKTFVIDKNSYKIDLALTIEPRGLGITDGVQARIFLPAPYMPELRLNNIIRGLSNNEQNTVEKIKPTAIENKAWGLPTLFGAENRYFIHALVADHGKFARRAYYKIEGVAPDRITAIIEGPTVKEKTTWNLSFYCGPKEAESMVAVDPRLEETLDYGWFALISKFLLYILKYLYSYVHNYGWAIIILTLIAKIILVPFTLKSQKSIQQQVELEKKRKYIEQKYKHDSEALNREKVALMTKQGGFSSMGGMIIPILVQVPLFIGLNKVLSNSIELYQAPFMGWITDLSVKDPYYIIPLLVGIGGMLQISTTSDARQKLVSFLGALIFIGITANLSAGLALFFCVDRWASFVQMKIQQALKI